MRSTLTDDGENDEIMDIDFPLVLMVATAGTGLIALVDKLWLGKRRSNNAMSLDEPPKEPFIIEQSKSFFPVLALVFVLRSFVAEPFQIPSGSMEPGLIKGDFILVSKFHYGLRMPVFGNELVPIGMPERGDVMVFFPPEDPRYFIKRVVGLPGDTIEYRNRQLLINGEAVVTKEEGGVPVYNPVRFRVTEQLGEHEADIQWVRARDTLSNKEIMWAGPEGKWRVPEGHYFMMGDNRGNSADSRSWGFVPERNIVGKATAVWMHWESWSDIPSFDRNRWLD